MIRIFLALLWLLAALPASAQQVHQSGTITPGHPASWITNGTIGDAGTAASGALSGLGVKTQGDGVCQISAPVTGPYNKLCLGVSGTQGYVSFSNFNGAPQLPLNFIVNGVPTSPGGALSVGPGQIAGNYAVGNNGVTAVNWMASGAGIPPWLSNFQDYVNTAGAPTADVRCMFLGTNCVTWANINTTAQTMLIAPAVLPIATTSILGAVIPDGTTITVNGSGVITSVASTLIIGSTTVGSGTNGSLLYNNNGILGNEAFATLAQGGANQALTASAGGIVWSDASKLNILAGTATPGLCLLSGNLATPSWGSCAGASAVASLGNAAADTSLTIAGTGSGPWTGVVTAKVNLANSNAWTVLQKFIASGDGILISNNAAATALTNQGLDVVEDSVPGSITLTTYGVSGLTNMPTFVGQTARGSLASPAVVQANDVLASFSGRGYIGSGFATSGRAFLRSLASETWSATANGAYWSFATTASGTTNTVEVLRIENDGGMTVPATVVGGDKGVGSINVGSLFVAGTALTLPVTLANGGTNNALAASNGGVVYSDATKLNILAGTVTAGQCLLSGSSTAPTWGSCSAGSTVATVGNASADTSLTIAGTGSGPWTGAVTVALNLANAQAWTAAQSFAASGIKLKGSSTGLTTFTSANAGGSNFTLTFPAVTDSLAVLASNQTFSATETFSGTLSVTGSLLVNGVPGRFLNAASTVAALSLGSI